MSFVLVDSYVLTAIRDLNFEILEDMTRTAPAEAASTLWSRSSSFPSSGSTATTW